MTRRKKRLAQPLANQSQLAGAQALERFAPLFDQAEWQLVLKDLEQPSPPAVRLNLLKSQTSVNLKEWALHYSWQVKPVPFCPSGWQVTSAQILPSQTIEHHLGYCYIQDASSMLPAELFEFEGDAQPLILDMAASPGGKTTHLVDRTGDRGLVLANDASASRLPALRIILSNWGAINTAIINFPGEQIGAWYPETFDAVLLDAPCSMESLHSTSSHPMRTITGRERQGLANRQASLLASAFQAVKPGGQVVYSTCTLAPEEDEAVLDNLLSRYPGTFEITSAPVRLALAAPGLDSFQGQQYSPAVSKALRLWPHLYATAGFFAARIVKKQSLPITSRKGPTRPWEKTGLVRLPHTATATLADQLLQTYGFDLKILLEKQSIGLWQRRSQVYAISDLYQAHFTELPCSTLGMLVGEFIHDDFYASHELLARLAAGVQHHQWLLPRELISAWLRGEDLPLAESFAGQSGTVICVKSESGVYLGRGKVLHDRLKNMLLRRLVQANLKY
jgi:16S rRNA (cytosine1407-C5)-methyltransferase